MGVEWEIWKTPSTYKDKRVPYNKFGEAGMRGIVGSSRWQQEHEAYFRSRY